MKENGDVCCWKTISDFSVGNFTNSTSRKNSFTSSSSNDVVWGFIFSYYVVWLNLGWWKSIFENLLSPRKTFSYGHFLFRRVLSVVWILQLRIAYVCSFVTMWGCNNYKCWMPMSGLKLLFIIIVHNVVRQWIFTGQCYECSNVLQVSTCA